MKTSTKNFYEMISIYKSMRLMLKFTPLRYYPAGLVNKHTIQGLIYSLLQDTKFNDLHNRAKFKFFTYSDIFPPGDFYPNKEKDLIISSPNPEFIRELKSSLSKVENIYLSTLPSRILSVKTFNLKISNIFSSGSPLVLLKDADKGEYFSLREHQDRRFLLNRVKENALKKYNAYYDDELSLEGEIFDRWLLKKEVAINMSLKGKNFVIIGSVWKNLEKFKIPKELRKFYKFLMDAGIGEKNSLGFGFINPIGGENGSK